MKTIAVFDDKNYNINWHTYSREAARAIVIKGDKIAMVKSLKEGFYKFPGGGIEKGESHFEALARETLEETGLHIIPNTIQEFGMIKEIRKSILGDEEIFNQTSYYYYAKVSEEKSLQILDDYEAELGFTLEWVDITKAYQTNISLSNNYESNFLIREAKVLELLKNSDEK